MATKPTEIWRGVMLLIAVVSLAVFAFLMLKPGGTTPVTQPERGASASEPAVAPGPSRPAVDERELAELKSMLQKDPENAQLMTTLANRLYDAGRYTEAIPLYEKVLQKSPRDVNVSTDLGTALWYSGKADDAISQFEKSLAIDPTHAQTLYNMGIVKLHGKNDLRGALEMWEKLLASHPEYPEASRLRSQIDALKKML